MQNFDWQTDEDETLWETEPRPEIPRPPNWRRWIYLLVAILALSVAGIAVGRQVNQRVQETQEATKADVLAADNLARTAAAEKDSEVLITLLSGRDPNWTQTQEALLDAHLLYGRAATPFGLEALEDDPAAMAVELSTDLNTAVVSGEQAFTVQNLEGESSETIKLAQTWIYRRGRRNWLLSPPDDEFWGEWETTSGEYVTVVYPNRDEAFAVSFAADLDSKLDAFCRQSGLDCPAGFHMNVRLDTDPQALLNLAEPGGTLGSGTRLELPTVSLVGTPVGETAYTALVRGYSAHVLTAAVGEIVGWECCDHILFYQAIMDYLLVEQELKPWPLAPEAYLELVDTPGDEAILGVLWMVDRLETTPSVEKDMVRAYVDFLIETGSDPVMMLEKLVEGNLDGAVRFTNWALQGSNRTRQELASGWDEFLRDKVEAYQEVISTPADLPTAKVALYCTSDTGTGIIMRYDPQAGVLEELLLLEDEFVLGRTLTDGKSLVYTAGDSAGTAISTTYWQFGNTPILIQPAQPEEILLYIGQPADPQGNQFPLWVFNDASTEGLGFAIAEQEDCRVAETCRAVSIPGIPIWSPDGTRIIVEEADGMLLLGDRDLEDWTSLGPGFSPVWLTNDTYAHLNGPGRLIRLKQMDEEGGVNLFDVEDLSHLLPENRQGFTLRIQKLFFHPQRPHTLIMLATPGMSADMFMFALQPDQPDQDWFAAVENEALHTSILFEGRPLNFSGTDEIFSSDGRWLSMRTASGELLIHDLETGLTSTVGRTSDFNFFQYAWMPDGPWLSYIGFDHIELIRPEQDGTFFRHFFFLDGQLCNSTSWIKP